MEQELEQLETPQKEMTPSSPLIGEGVFPDEGGNIVCRRCNRKLPAKTAFFTRKDSSRQPLCKECLTKHIDNKDTSSFEWILELFDVPYVEHEWIKIYNDTLAAKGRVARDSVLGKYLRQMKLQQYNKFGYKDTEELAYKYHKEQQEIAARQILNDEEAQLEMMRLQEQLDRGEISQSQFDTLSPLTNGQFAFEEKTITFAENDNTNEEDILKSLTEEEVKMLRLKWGSTYKPSQWIKMEDEYVRYENEYEIDVDREESLKKICKIDLKADEALDIGDIKGARDLTAMADTLRKSALFTKAQNKENQQKYLDSIGELVAFCEQKGGIIEQIPYPDEYPQDDVDYAIKNLKAYYYDLVTSELGLGNMIEAYIKRVEEAEKQNEIDMDGGMITSQEEMEEYAADLEAMEFQENLLDDIDAEIAEILGEEA